VKQENKRPVIRRHYPNVVAHGDQQHRICAPLHYPSLTFATRRRPRQKRPFPKPCNGVTPGPSVRVAFSCRTSQFQKPTQMSTPEFSIYSWPRWEEQRFFVCSDWANRFPEVHHSNRDNPLTPNHPYNCRTAPLNSKSCILYIYSTNIGTEYFKHGINSPFFFFTLQNAVCFIILTYLVPVLFTFYIQGVLKLKK